MEAAMSSSDGVDPTEVGIELWRVQLPTGELRAMSLDALDEAFQAGVIDETTPVLPPGATAWTKLGDAAGLDSTPAEPMVPSLAPLAVSIASSPESIAPRPFAPVTDAALMELAAEDEAAFKPKRGRLFAVVGVAVVLALGLGLGATRLSGLAASASATSSLSAQAGQKVAATPPPAAVDVNEAAPVKQLTPEQKARLAEADKAREAAAAAREEKRRKDRPPPPLKRGPREKSAQPFVNGGSKYDPLNGAL
jgi:hypothetical protein